MASMTVVGVFDNANEAQQAVEALVSDGFSRSNIDLSTAQSGSQSYNTGDYNSGSNTGTAVPDRHQNTSGTMAEEVVDDTKDVFSKVGDSIPDRHRNTSGTMAEEVVDDTKDVGSSIGNFFSSLFGLDDDKADRYARAAEQSSIVTVHTQSEDEAERAADILDDNGAVDVDERAATYGSTTSSGMMGSSATMGATGFVDDTMNTAGYDRTNAVDGDQKIQVVEENLQVGKREVETGGVRVRSRIVERPVEENLRLREERVVVQRNPVNRPATDADLNAFQEGQIEVRETAEQAVVSKTANVVEEISIGKEVNEREETIRDTVRKTEVDVENLGSNDQTLRTDQTSNNDRSVINPDGTAY